MISPSFLIHTDSWYTHGREIVPFLSYLLYQLSLWMNLRGKNHIDGVLGRWRNGNIFPDSWSNRYLLLRRPSPNQLSHVEKLVAILNHSDVAVSRWRSTKWREIERHRLKDRETDAVSRKKGRQKYRISEIERQIDRGTENLSYRSQVFYSDETLANSESPAPGTTQSPILVTSLPWKLSSRRRLLVRISGMPFSFGTVFLLI